MTRKMKLVVPPNYECVLGGEKPTRFWGEYEISANFRQMFDPSTVKWWVIARGNTGFIMAYPIMPKDELDPHPRVISGLIQALWPSDRVRVSQTLPRAKHGEAMIGCAAAIINNRLEEILNCAYEPSSSVRLMLTECIRID